MAVLLWARIVFLVLLSLLTGLYARTAYRTRDDR